MKAQWLHLLGRIDAMSLRERISLLLSAMVCVLALVDVFLMSPAQDAQRKLAQRFNEQVAELTRLQDELRLVAQPVDASKSVREALAAAEQRQQSLQAQIQDLLPTGRNGPELEQVLVQFLRRQSQLKLVSVSTSGAEAAAPPTTANGPPSTLPFGLAQRTINLKVAGPYPELVRYVKTLEAALPSLRWGNLHVSSASDPPELILQVQVLGAPQ